MVLAVVPKGTPWIRYPGGKQRLLPYFAPFLPHSEDIQGTYVEPFVGSASTFFAINPRRAILSDVNPELITIYEGVKDSPDRVWDTYRRFLDTKSAYYKVRAARLESRSVVFRAARLLYLNRTCFKGMWRQNREGDFNVGYGGQDRRWVITKKNLMDVSSRLHFAKILESDFEPVVDGCGPSDFLFCDPPYCPGQREITHSHYVGNRFDFAEHQRLVRSLRRASERAVMWAMTTSSHPDILQLLHGENVLPISIGTGKSPGVMTRNPGEVLVCNYPLVEACHRKTPRQRLN